MNLVPKLTLALVAAMCGVLAVNAYFRVRREVAYVDADRVRDHEMVGRALATSVGSLWRSEGRVSALQVIEAAQSHFARLDIRWVEPEAVTSACGHVWRTQADFSAAPISRPFSAAPGAERGRLRTCIAVGSGQVREGAIALVEEETSQSGPVWTAIKDASFTAVAIASVAAVVAMLLGLWLVGAPVRALTDKARRIGRGDFTGPLRFRRSDEFSILAQELNAMCERLLSTIEQLRHADRLGTVGKLASGVAHELGTPLNVISARAAMIAAGETTAEETVDSARVIGTAAERMTNIIQSLLVFARKKGAQKARQDVLPIIHQTIDLLRPLARKRGVDLEIATRADDVATVAEVDSAQFAQVVTNLVMNGVHAIPSGGRVTVDISREPRRRPTATDDRLPVMLCIRVKDEGTGIQEADLPHVFEPFYTTKDVGEGTGLGLSVSYGIMQEHGGWIDVTSKVGAGSTFTIVMPTSENE